MQPTLCPEGSRSSGWRRRCRLSGRPHTRTTLMARTIASMCSPAQSLLALWRRSSAPAAPVEVPTPLLHQAEHAPAPVPRRRSSRWSVSSVSFRPRLRPVSVFRSQKWRYEHDDANFATGSRVGCWSLRGSRWRPVREHPSVARPRLAVILVTCSFVTLGERVSDDRGSMSMFLHAVVAPPVVARGDEVPVV